MLFDVRNQIVTSDRLDIFRGSKDRPTQGSSLISCRVQMIENYFLEISLDFLHFPENHTTFSLDLALAKLRILYYVAQDFNGFRNILSQTLGVKNCLFPAGVCVQMGSHVFDLKLQISLWPLCSALKMFPIKMSQLLNPLFMRNPEF